MGGFGDLETSDATRNFNIGYMIIAVGVVANGFGTLVEVIGIVGKIHRIEEFCKAGVSNDMIDKMDEDGDSKVDRYEFCTYMLVTAAARSPSTTLCRSTKSRAARRLKTGQEPWPWRLARPLILRRLVG